MEFHQLHTFVQVAKVRNFSRAAEELMISQPAVSRQIEALEKSLNTQLFKRAGRTVELTESGTLLFEQAEQILQLVQKARSSIQSLNCLETGLLMVGASTTIGSYSIAPVVLKFMERYPGLEVKLDIQSTMVINSTFAA